MRAVDPYPSWVQVELPTHDDLPSGVNRRGGRVVNVVIDLQLVTQGRANHELLFTPVDAGARDHDPPEGDLRSAPTLGDVLVQCPVIGRDASRRGRLPAVSGDQPQ